MFDGRHRMRVGPRHIRATALVFMLCAFGIINAQAPARTEDFVDRGLGEFNAGRYKEALTVFERCIIELKPGPWDCRLWKATTLLAFRDRRTEGAAEFEKLVAERPNDLTAHYGLGRAYMVLSKVPESIRAFTRCIEIDRNFRKAYMSRANQLAEEGKFDEAIADLTVAIRLDPADAIAYDLRGKFYMRRWDHARAVADLTRSIELDPKFAEPLITRGIIFGLQEKYDHALADLNKAIVLAPGSTIAYKARAAVHCNSGKKSLANQDEAKVVELGGKVEQPCKY